MQLLLVTINQHFYDTLHSGLRNGSVCNQVFVENLLLLSKLSALIQTLKCTADLIEDLLQEGFDYVLISRLQSDPLERRFSKYRQMSAGRFLVALREVLCSEKILQMKSLLKENLNLWELDVRPEDDVLNIAEDVEFQNDFEEIDLDDDRKEVATYIAGYITKKLLKKSTCELCRK